jgi:hypothetical protein
MTDPDVVIARAKWDSKEWSPWDVCRSLELQWLDQHQNMGDTDGNGIDDDAEVNAHSPEAVALYAEAVAACALELAAWLAKAATLAAALAPK